MQVFLHFSFGLFGLLRFFVVSLQSIWGKVQKSSEFAKFPNKNTPSSHTELCQTAEQIIAKLRNELLPNCGTKFRQIAEKFQKYLHMSVIFTTFAAFFKK